MAVRVRAPKARPYDELRALPARAYLRPDDFVTEFDGIREGYAAEQYAAGLAVSRGAVFVSITCAGTWAARMPGRVTTSCEGIGYHAHTADLLRGFLDGPAPVVVYRWNGPPGGVQIKPAAAGHRGTWAADGGTETYTTV